MSSTTAAAASAVANSTVSNAVDFCNLSYGVAVALVMGNVVIAVSGLALNLLVVLVIATNRVLRKCTINRLLLSLAVADLIVNVFAQPAFSAQVMYTHRRRCLDTWAYHAFTISCSSSVFLSLLFLTMVTVERFLAVTAPVIHRRFLTPKLVSRLVAFIVLLTVAFQSFSYHERQSGRSFRRAWIFGAFCLVAIVMNTCTMICTRRFLQRRLRSPSRSNAEREALKAKMQRVTLLLLLLVMALLAWLLVILIVALHFADLLSLGIVYGILTLIFLNSCLNPIAYCFMAPDIRKATRLFISAANPLNLLKRPVKEDELRTPAPNNELRTPVPNNELRTPVPNNELRTPEPRPRARETEIAAETAVQIPRNNMAVETQLLVFRIINMFLSRLRQI